MLCGCELWVVAKTNKTHNSGSSIQYKAANKNNLKRQKINCLLGQIRTANLTYKLHKKTCTKHTQKLKTHNWGDPIQIKSN